MNGKSSKIEELYSSLSRQNKEGITSFLSCDLFNQSEIVLAIHLYLCEALTHESELDKMALYRTVFSPKEKYSDVKLRVFMTKLVKLIERYIVVKNLDQYPLAELTLLTRHYSKNHLHKNHSIFFNSKTEIQFESYDEQLMYDFAHAMLKLDFINQEFSNDIVKVGSHFETMLLAQRKMSCFQTLKTQCDFLSFTQKFKSKIDNSYGEAIINELIKDKDELDDSMKGYLLVYLIFQNNSSELFFELKNLLLSSNIIYESNYKALLSHAENFCIKFINNGQTDFLQHLFEIYNCEIKFFKNEGDLRAVNFRNIVYTALQLNQLSWSENFVESYYTKVPLAEQENNYNFNYARIFFERKEYKQAMRQLLKVTYEHSFYASIGRILLIKCYYELNDEMPLISCCLSLNQFLNRSKEFTKQRVENNLHFIKYVKMLQKHRLENDKPYFKKLYQKVKESTVVEKEWLLKKIEELY